MKTIRFRTLGLGLAAFAVIHWIPATSLAQPVILITNSTAIDTNNNAFEGDDIIVSNCTLTVSGLHDFNSLTLVSNAILTHPAAPDGETNNQVDLTIAADALVDGSSQIVADGLGYSAGAGPGAGVNGNSSASGGYGGMGGTVNSGGGGAAYGFVAQPVDFGSGGGDAGASGGGAVELVVEGTLDVDGLISANGLMSGNNHSGGSGGSIWLQAANISGNGVIEANGANGSDNAAGGGRVALDYQTSTFTGTTVAWGGAQANGQDGGAGTVYFQQQSNPLALVLVDNDGHSGAWTPADLMEGTNFVVTVTNGAQAAIWGGKLGTSIS